MKKLIMLFIVIISFAIPWIAYGAKIPKPKASADMYNWQTLSSINFEVATIMAECNDDSDIWTVKENSWKCLQIKYKTTGVMMIMNSIRPAPNCHCPPSSY